MNEIIMHDDSQGEWKPLLRACAEEPSVTVVILGDCDPDAPLSKQMALLLEADIAPHWMLGNHDCDFEQRYNFLRSDYCIRAACQR